MGQLDRAAAAMAGGDEAAARSFYAALAQSELLLVLESEAEGETLAPRLIDTGEARLVLAYDDEERLSLAFPEGAPFAALPGRVIAAQLAGQGIGLGLNLGTGAACEMHLPAEAMDWLVAMLARQVLAEPALLRQARPSTLPPDWREVIAALLSGLGPGISGAGLVAGRSEDGAPWQELLVVLGAPPEAQEPIARALAEALAFAGAPEGALAVLFAAEPSALPGPLGAALHPLILTPPAPAPASAAQMPGHMPGQAPGMDPARPPILKPRSSG